MCQSPAGGRGSHGGYPMLTFTAPWTAATVAHVPPSPAYLRTLAAGLREAHGWTDDRIARYLSVDAASFADPSGAG